jgi:hypothetical protein
MGTPVPQSGEGPANSHVPPEQVACLSHPETGLVPHSHVSPARVQLEPACGGAEGQGVSPPSSGPLLLPLLPVLPLLPEVPLFPAEVPLPEPLDVLPLVPPLLEPLELLPPPPVPPSVAPPQATTTEASITRTLARFPFMTVLCSRRRATSVPGRNPRLPAGIRRRDVSVSVPGMIGQA